MLLGTTAGRIASIPRSAGSRSRRSSLDESRGTIRLFNACYGMLVEFSFPARRRTLPVPLPTALLQSRLRQKRLDETGHTKTGTARLPHRRMRRHPLRQESPLLAILQRPPRTGALRRAIRLLPRRASKQCGHSAGTGRVGDWSSRSTATSIVVHQWASHGHDDADILSVTRPFDGKHPAFVMDVAA